MSIDFDSAAIQTQHDEEEYDQEDFAREQELHKLLTDLPDDMLDDSRDSLPEVEESACNNNTGNSQQAPWTHQWSDQPPAASHEEDNDLHEVDYTYNSMGHPVEYNAERNSDPRNHFHNVENHSPGDKNLDPFQARYHPHQPVMFNTQAPQSEARFDHLQREFFDSTQQTADKEQIAQLKVLNEALKRQIEEVERQLEDSRRNIRYLEHQFEITKDEKESLAAHLKEASRLIEEAKKGEFQMQNKVKSLEQQLAAMTEMNQGNLKKQREAEIAMDSMKQQMLEVCRSDTLSRTREQHDRDISIIREQHQAAMSALQQKLSFNTEETERLREQLKLLESQREEDQVDRARVVNTLTQHLQESQKQCAMLLQTGSVQEMSQVQIKLQQAESAKALCENMNQVLQEDLADLKEQITLYESAVKHGIISLDSSKECENQLSDSCLDLGLKRSNWKNGILHRTALTNMSDAKLPKDEATWQLRTEMQRCLANLKGKRQKINQLQEELQHSQARANDLQTQLEKAQPPSTTVEMSKRSDGSKASQEDTLKLQEVKQHLQAQVELLEKKNQELRLSEEKLKSSNLELCTKMREMIQELDKEKQEAAERSERIHQQYRDDVVNHVTRELEMLHSDQVDQLTANHQQEIQQLQALLDEAHDKMTAVQECYISVCKEKSNLEETLRSKENEQKKEQENVAALEILRAELQAEHKVTVNQLKALWTKEKETEIQQRVDSQIASERAVWKNELKEMEGLWAHQLEEAKRCDQTETAEVTCQTDGSQIIITAQELDSRFQAQTQQLLLQAEKAKQNAVEEARKQTEMALHQKHLEDMANQVEGAIARAYNQWIEDLTSLPEHQAILQNEKAKWDELHEQQTQQQVAKALKEANQQWTEMHHRAGQSSDSPRLRELQERVVSLQGQLELKSAEQATLLKAELAAARAAWTRDKQQEISTVHVRCEQSYQAKLDHLLQQAREEADLQRKELLRQMEAQLHQARQETWRSQTSEADLRQRARGEFLTELQAELSQAQAQLFEDSSSNIQKSEKSPQRVPQQVSSPCRKEPSAESSLTHTIQSFCNDIVSKAVFRAKTEWKKVSEERLSCVLKQTVEQHGREINKLQNALSQRSPCGKECVTNIAKLQKKNQELQRHLEKACRQLQHTVKEHDMQIKHLKEGYGNSLEKVKEEHVKQLQEVKSSAESARSAKQNLKVCVDEMKQQYLTAVGKIKGDMLQYLQQNRERVAETIRMEVLRERQDTARKMRSYYLTCLQELLQDGEPGTGAEKKIISAASKLAAMAKVLETPIKSKSGNNHGFPSSLVSSHTDLSTHPPAITTLPIRAEETGRGARCNYKISAPSQQISEPSRDLASVSTRSMSYTDEPSNPSNSFPTPEAPFTDQKPSDWSLTTTDSDSGEPRLSFPGKKVKTVKPFSVSGSASDFADFGIFTPDSSDVTVYNDIAKTPKTSALPGSSSEAHKDYIMKPRPVFSVLKHSQQDSGVDSPLFQKGGPMSNKVHTNI